MLRLFREESCCGLVSNAGATIGVEFRVCRIPGVVEPTDIGCSECCKSGAKGVAGSDYAILRVLFVSFHDHVHIFSSHWDILVPETLVDFAFVTKIRWSKKNIKIF